MNSCKYTWIPLVTCTMFEYHFREIKIILIYTSISKIILLQNSVHTNIQIFILLFVYE